MTPLPHLIAQHQTLSRRIASLPAELDIWIERAAADHTLEKNFSQIEALDHFMRTLCTSNEESFNVLNPAADADVFLNRAFDLAKNLVKSNFIWDFFRDRLELRFVPQFRQPLLMADLISYDCYTTIVDRAKALQIYPEQYFREYPLTGLAAEFCPSTWARGRRPWGLQNPALPIPVIDLPWDHLINPWELLTIAHEVGHDIDKDLGKLTSALQPTIANQLEAVQTPTERILQWQRWTSEILADLVGILLTGPAFVQMLTGMLTLPTCIVRRINPAALHPPRYLRAFINTAMVRRLGMTQSTDAVEADWKALYGEPGNEFNFYLPEVELVISAILDTSLATLQDLEGKKHSLSELITFTPKDQSRIQEASAKLTAGAPLPGKLSIRHVVSASQIAFERMVQSSDTVELAALARHTQQAIIDLSPPGQLPIGLTSPRARRHLDDLALACLERPLRDFGIHWPANMEER